MAYNDSHTIAKSAADTAPLKLYRRRQELIDALAAGQAAHFLENHSGVLDDYFRETYAASRVGPTLSLRKNPYALVALGGYGRQEQCLHSDIDLLFLFHKRVPPAATQLVEEVLFPLWNLGFEVGHATRSVKECLQAARDDFENLTAMLDARFLCGMSPLYSEMDTLLRKRLINKKGNRVVSWLVESNRERHRRFGDSAHMLQPNLKEGQGGLRDYHTLLWIARAKYGVQGRHDLKFAGFFSHDEIAQLEEALAFVWKVRNHLHLLAGRKCDRLYFEYQVKLASILGFNGDDGQQGVERFLGRLQRDMEAIKYQCQLFLYEQGLQKVRGSSAKISRVPKSSAIRVQEGKLNFVRPEAVLQNPELLMRIFEYSARFKLPLNAEAKRIVKDFGHLVDDDLRRLPAALKSFEKVLLSSTPTFNVLSEMLNTGFLVRYLPEFQHVTNRILYNAYHIYPVDRHSLRTVRTLKSFGSEEDISGCKLCERLYREVRSKRMLLWAALLHDIGKGKQSDSHSERGADIARGLLGRVGASSQVIESVAFLVRHHLLLVKIATRRDVNDEETAIHCARIIKTAERLKMLYLLTVADSVATGPKAWNEWTGTLLQDLFLKVANIINKGEFASIHAVQRVERKKKQLLDGSDPSRRDALEKLVTALSPRYLLYEEAEDIERHLSLYAKLKDRPFAWQIEATRSTERRTVTLCAPDQPGLFSKIAGVFTLHHVDILGAQIYTWRNRVALDIFEVSPPPDRIFEKEKWDQAARDLENALSGKLDLHARLAKRTATQSAGAPPGAQRGQQVRIDNESSSFWTIIEVIADDYTGLLFQVTNAFYLCGVDIRVAKISTKLDQVLDVFYVSDLEGQKIGDPGQLAQIKKAVGVTLARE